MLPKKEALDLERLQEVFLNLFINAYHAMRSQGGGTLTVTTSVESGHVVVSFTDTGPGIPIEYHEKVFEKFGQVEIRKTRKMPSSGLGLAFCKLAVEAQCGNIRLESEPGHGSTFHVRLPRHAPGASQGNAA